MIFSHQRYLVVSNWNLSGWKSPHVSRTFLSIFADLNNVLVKIVLICPQIYNSSSPLSLHLGTVPSVSITIATPVCCIAFFVLYKVYVIASYFTIFDFHSVVLWDGNKW